MNGNDTQMEQVAALSVLHREQAAQRESLRDRGAARHALAEAAADKRDATRTGRGESREEVRIQVCVHINMRVACMHVPCASVCAVHV